MFRKFISIKKKINMYFIILLYFFPTMQNNLFASSALKNEKRNEIIIYCNTDDVLQKCFDEAEGKTLILAPGIHYSYMTQILSNTKVVIPQGATIKLSDNAVMPLKGGYVLGAYNKNGTYAYNIHIILNGTVDGNKSFHPYEKSGNEGISFGYVKDCSISGNGTVKNASGDGIDVDAVENCFFQGIKVLNNDGTGFHFGSPRPIKASKNNTVFNIYAEGNGFKHFRNGIDLSWPNENGANFKFELIVMSLWAKFATAWIIK